MPDPSGPQVEIQHLRLEVARLEHALTSAQLLAVLLQPPPAPVVPLDLSPRDREVLARMVEGDTNQQIADRLYLSIHTIKMHVDMIMRRFGVRTRTGAVTAAARAGFVPPDQRKG